MPFISPSVLSVHFLTIVFPKSPVFRPRWRAPIGKSLTPPMLLERIETTYGCHPKYTLSHDTKNRRTQRSLNASD